MIGKNRFYFLVILIISFCLIFGFSSVLAQNTSEVYNFEEYNEKYPEKEITSFNEPPQLNQEVEKGKLPPVEERLPENPLVVTPWRKTGKYGGTWKRFATWEEWGHFRTAISGFHLSRFINDGLDIVPNILTHWESNEDKSEWTLYFRKGVKWSDGHPLTVDDMLFWYRDMAKNPECSNSVWDWNRAGGELVEMKKIDDYTLKLEYTAPSPLLIGRIAISPRTGAFGHMLIPKHYLKEYHPDYNDEYENFNTFDEKKEWWHNPEMPVLSAWKPVEEEPGEKLILERNPFYFAVDPEGNQLPYIDKVDIRMLSDSEVFKLKASRGNIDFQIRPGVLNVRDISMLKQNEEEYNFDTLTWNSASGTGPVFYPNRNHPDSEKQDLYQNPKFLKALSHAINRGKINRMVFYGSGMETTGTFSPQCVEYHRSEKGQEIFKKWRDSAKVFNPEKSKKILNEIGVIDQNDDGWRELPNGDKLELRIDMDAEAGVEYTDTNSIVKDNWSDIGLKTIINPMDGSQLQVMQTNATFDIRDSWEVANPYNHLMNGRWLVPFGNSRWAPLYGAWEMTRGTEEEGTELDKDPRDRTPPRQKPPEGGPVDQLQKIRKKAMVTPSKEKRDELVFDMINIHIEKGPFIIGTVGDYYRVGVVSDRMKNVPRKEDLPLGGYVNPWFSYEDGANPMIFYIDEEE